MSVKCGGRQGVKRRRQREKVIREGLNISKYFTHKREIH
jgi:hypothetical protein